MTTAGESGAIISREVTATWTGRWAAGSAAQLAHASVLVALQILLNGVGFSVVAPAVLGGSDFEFRGAPREFVAVAAIAALGMGLDVGIALCAVARISLRQLGWTRVRWPWDVGAGVLGFGACAATILGTIAWRGGDVHALVSHVGDYSLAQRLLFLFIGVTAAFYEESLFRGYLQPALVARVGAVGGIVLTAAVFSVYHLQFHPASLVAKFGLGLVFGGLRARGRTLLAPATAHALVWAVIGAA